MPTAPQPATSVPGRVGPTFLVSLPGGGKIPLQTQPEADLWKESAERYIDDYQLTQQNDLNLLGAILSQQLILYRAQQVLSGMTPEFDNRGLPTGNYVRSQATAREMAAAQATLTKAADQIREIEKSLGVDKKTREAGGTHTVQQYVLTLKAAAREYGLHIAERLKEYERVTMDARQRLRILHNADEEDRAYHNITPESICSWLHDELAALEELDKVHAKTRQKLYLGKT